MADDDMKKFDALNEFEDGLVAIKDTMTGEDALQAKIALVWAAVGDGTIPLTDGEALVESYKDEWASTNTVMNNIRSNIGDLIKTNFPSLNSAFDSSKTAVGDFKSAFKGDNGKSFIENIGNGFGNVNTAILAGKAAMEEFGGATGLALSALEIAVPGFGMLVTNVLGVLKTLGIDVGKIIDDAAAKLLGFLKTGEGVDPTTAILEKFKMLISQAQIKLPDVDLTEVAGKVLQIRGENLVDTQDLIREYLRDAFSEGLDDPELVNYFLYLIEQFVSIMTPFLSGIFAGQGGGGGGGDGGGGGGEGYSQEQQKQFFDTYDNYANTGSYSPLQLWNLMVSMFGEAMTRALIGNPPEFAKGGMVFGEMLAMVGDNPNAANDPEIISPLSKLNEMLVQPALNAISSLMGAGGGTQQVIYVTLDGRTLAESTFYNLPDVVRMHTGGLQ
jgi:hypothetical protein